MINQVQEIVNGWKNLIFQNPVSEEIGEKRSQVCIVCINYKSQTKRCGICNCYVPAAVRSAKKRCPKGKW